MSVSTPCGNPVSKWSMVDAHIAQCMECSAVIDGRGYYLAGWIAGRAELQETDELKEAFRYRATELLRSAEDYSRAV